MGQSPLSQEIEVADQSDTASDISSVAFPAQRGDIPQEDDITVELTPLLRWYEKLHGTLCRRQLSKIPEISDSFIRQLSQTVVGVRDASGPIRYTSGYDSAYEDLTFSRELLESHFDKMSPHNNEDDMLATGYLLMEMTMSNFRNFLHVVEIEREYMESPPEPEAETSFDIEPFTIRISPEPSVEKEKKGLFARLRKISFACKALFDISAPPSPISPDASATILIVEPPYDLDDMDYDTETPYNVRASLAVFPEPSPKLAEPNLPTVEEEEAGVIRHMDGTITAATLEQMVRLLTDQREILAQDMTGLMDSFFLFFRSFAPPASLLERLVSRFNEQAPVGLNEEQHHVWGLFHRFAKIYVAKLLYFWVERYWKDETDNDILDDIIRFTFGTMAKDRDLPPETVKLVASGLCECSSGRIGKYGYWLEKEMKQADEAAEVYADTVFQPRLQRLETLRHDDLGMIDIGYFRSSGGAEELARQFTVIESELFHTFVPEELIHFGDAKFRRKIEDWKVFTNALTLWVSTCILDHQDVALRAQIIQLFLFVATASTVTPCNAYVLTQLSCRNANPCVTIIQPSLSCLAFSPAPSLASGRHMTYVCRRHRMVHIVTNNTLACAGIVPRSACPSRRLL